MGICQGILFFSIPLLNYDTFILQVFVALSQLDFGSEVWERVLLKSLELLTDSNDEPLAVTIDFIFKAASQCQHLPEAVRVFQIIIIMIVSPVFPFFSFLFPLNTFNHVFPHLQVRSVRVRLKNLGAEVSPCVLDFLSKTVNSWGDVAETILRDIDCDDDFGDNCSTMPSGLFLFGENGPTSDSLHVMDEQAFRATRHFSDIYILIEMLSIPCIAVEAAQTFERAVARGTIVAQSIALVLERRLAQRLNFNPGFVAENFQHTDVVVEGEQLIVQRDDFTCVLGLAETLALSRDIRVREFVKILYTILLKWYPDESYRGRMLKRLVDRATSTTESSRGVDLDLEILVILVCEEQEIIRPVLSMLREVAELANVDRAALWHQLCASEDEIIRIRDERKAEISNMVREKAVFSQKLAESEAAGNRLKVLV